MITRRTPRADRPYVSWVTPRLRHSCEGDVLVLGERLSGFHSSEDLLGYLTALVLMSIGTAGQLGCDQRNGCGRAKDDPNRESSSADQQHENPAAQLGTLGAAPRTLMDPAEALPLPPVAQRFLQIG